VANLELLEQYKAYMEDLGNIGERQSGSRRFYLSVMSALLVFLSASGKGKVLGEISGEFRIVICIAALCICALWFLHMLSFRALFDAKFKVLREMEGEGLPFHIYKKEWNALKGDKRYKFFTGFDATVPILFALIYISIFVLLK